MFRFALAAYSLLLPFPSAIALDPGSTPPPRNGEELLTLMRERYAGKWYRTLTFTQKTTLPDGKIETWYEALELPGKLRIDIAPLDSGKTLLFRNDSLYVFDQKTLKASQPLVHPLMVLGFDVYQAPVKETAQKLRGLKFDLSKLHQTTWAGTPDLRRRCRAGRHHQPTVLGRCGAALLRSQPGTVEERSDRDQRDHIRQVHSAGRGLGRDRGAVPCQRQTAGEGGVQRCQGQCEAGSRDLRSDCLEGSWMGGARGATLGRQILSPLPVFLAHLPTVLRLEVRLGCLTFPPVFIDGLPTGILR